MTSLYLLIDLAALIIALFFSFRPRASFRKEWKWLLPSIGVVAIPTLLVNAQLIRIGAWGYNQDHILGQFVYLLPIEEILYYLCVPYLAMLGYYFCRYYFPGTQLKYSGRIIAGVSAALCLIIAAAYLDHLFTLISFLGVSIFLAFCFLRRPFWLGHLIISFSVFSIAFILYNSTLGELNLIFPIFKYEAAETMDVFVNNMPIECLPYSLLVFGSIISIYERFRGK